MGFALILLFAAHAALAGGFPRSARSAAMSSAGAGIHARESAQMNRLMAMSAAAVVTAGASAQNAVQWRVEDGGNGHWYLRTVSVDPPSWNLARQEAERLGGFLVTIHSEAENAIVRALVEVSGATHVWIGCRFVDGLGWRWIDGTSPGFTAWGGSNCLIGPYPNDPPYVGSAVAFANCVFTDTTSLRVWDDFPIVPIGYSPFPSIVEFSADCNADGIVDYGQIRSGELADANANNTRLRRALAGSETVDQGAVAQLLDEIPRHERRKVELLEREQKELAQFLTPSQRARYMALQEELRRGMQEVQRRRLGLDGGGRGDGMPPGGVPPRRPPW